MELALYKFSLRSRRLEVAGERENGRARGRHARGAHYFQAPAAQANINYVMLCYVMLFSQVTVPEVFAEVNSAQSPRF